MSQTSKALELPADPLIGHPLGGKYTIKKLIGRGGVGLVYTADQRDLNREVVVKVLAPNWANDDEALARFEREAKRLSGLKHPNIVTMYDYGKEGRRAYLVMEYLRGELLSEFVDRHGSLSLEAFVPVAAQILKGIGHAHSREMMVRDIKPANIMLCERKGRANFVKILDFGLAKLTKGEQAITEEHVMGTVGYLSPEQIRGDDIDLRVDVYALGVLFYYMLSGRLPFEGENNATVFYKTINEPPRRLDEVLPEGHDIPEGLINLIHSLLEKNREDRPSNADEIVEGLIDVVPAAMFRLPRAETQRHGIPAAMPPGHGNTGMMELLGTEVSPSAKHMMDPALGQGSDPNIRAAGSPLVHADTGVSAPIHIDPVTGAHTGQYPPQPQTGRTAMVMLAGALLAVLGGGLAVWMLMGDDKKDEVASTSSEPAAVGTPAPAEPDPAVVEAALTEADRLIGEGDFDGATRVLDEVRGLTKSLPTLAGRVDRTDHRIAIGRLMAAGSKFESDDLRDAAIEAYRDALELDPSHMPAREALARLDVETPTVEGAEDIIFGQVSISSRPASKVYIDGNPAGTTPFEGKLTVGEHTMRLMARGYYAFNETITVTEKEAPPISVTLKARGKSSKGSSSKDPEPAATAPEPTTSKPDPAPATNNKKKKSNPFLPTEGGKKEEKKQDSGNPFLPTKD